jgi:hypothetical protein
MKLLLLEDYARQCSGQEKNLIMIFGLSMMLQTMDSVAASTILSARRMSFNGSAKWYKRMISRYKFLNLFMGMGFENSAEDIRTKEG